MAGSAPGADALIGGPGVDTVDYSSASNRGVNVSLGTTRTSWSDGDGTIDDAVGDDFSSIENLVGTKFNDWLAGDSGDNRIAGRRGNDWIFGGGAQDTLFGGRGGDNLFGYGALTDLWYRDLHVFGSKLRYFSELAPEHHDRALATVLALPGLPDIADALAQGRVDMERFLEVRDSPDGRQFRRWFRSRRPGDIAALTDHWGTIRNRLGGWLATPRGKALRVVMSNGVGLLPGAGVVVGAIDAFLLERWLPQSQPLTFLLYSYKSIFRARDDDGSHPPEWE